MPGRPGRPQEIDRDTLHRLLWRRVDARRRIKVKGQDMAAQICVSPYHFSRIMAEEARAGRWTVVKTGQHSVKTYEVTDPAVWVQEREAVDA